MMRALLACALLASCSRETAPAATIVAATPACGLTADQIGAFIDIPEGSFEKGADALYPEELPAVRLHVAAFRIQAHEVTNAQFEQFVRATGYITDAERSAASPDPAGGSALFVTPDASNGSTGNWLLSRGSTWKTPEGPGSGIARRMAMPAPTRNGPTRACQARRSGNTPQPSALLILPTPSPAPMTARASPSPTHGKASSR
jgi:sulfatase modifying factor 1